ncbi:MAG: hypothetical protein QXX68_00515 [Candidatus Pacearchaeota archaeon]
MKESFLKNLFERIAGKGALPILEVLLKKKDISEILLSKRTGMPINEIRNFLYKLSSEGIVYFTRKKDKRRGWFIYFWSLNEERSLLKIEEEIIKEIENLKKDLEKRKNERFYKCEICKTEVNEESALEQEFVCPECANTYVIVDKDPFILEIQKNISRKEKQLEEIRKEIYLFKEKQTVAKEKTKRKESKDKKVKKGKTKKSKKKK